MIDNKVIEKIKEYVKNEMLNEETGHDWWHVNRVYNNSVYINKIEKANDSIIKIIALLHDLYDSKFVDVNVSKSIINLFKKLEVYKLFKKEDLDNIIYSIENMSYSKNIEKKIKLSKEGEIVQDADRLDAIGAIGIARTFAYGGKVKRPIYEPKIERKAVTTEEEYKNNKQDSIKHFYDKLLKLKDTMNTKTGFKLAEERHKYMEDFLMQFYKEWEGEKE